MTMDLQVIPSPVVVNCNGNESPMKNQQRPEKPSLGMLSPLAPHKQPLDDADTVSLGSARSITGLRQDSSGNNKSCLKIKTQLESLQPTGSRLGDDNDSHPRVQFSSQVHVRVHSTILSDHPGVSSGLPIGLGWEICQEFMEDMQENQPTVAQKIHLSAWDRQRLLILQGYSQAELRQAERDIKIIQDSRRRNARSSWIQPVWRYKSNNKNVKTVVSPSKHGRSKTTKCVRGL